MVGCALAIALSQGLLGDGRPALASTRVALHRVACRAAFTAHLDSRSTPVIAFGLSTIASAVLILHLVRTDRSLTARILGSPPLVWVGRLSYGLYLWHFPICMEFSLHGHSDLLWPVVLPLTFLVSSTSSYLIEKRALRLRHRRRPTADGDLTQRTLRDAQWAPPASRRRRARVV